MSGSMAQINASLQEALRSSQNARAFGRYNEAIAILDDYFYENPQARDSITARTEFALNYLAQGYLKRAHEALLHGLDETSVLARGVWDPELALFDLLKAVIGLRYGDWTSFEECEAICLRVWRGHLEILRLGEHTETHIRLELIFHELRHYVLARQRDPAGHFTAAITLRLVMICRQLSVVNRHSEALEVARLRKRLSPSFIAGVQYSDLLHMESDIVFLCCLGAILDKFEERYGMNDHGHAHIDMRTVRFQTRLVQTSITAEELDLEAMDLVSCYEDVDYPRGALFVMQLLLVWKSDHGLAYMPNHVELVRTLESRTGELLPIAGLHSILPRNPPQSPPIPTQTNMAGPSREGLINHRHQPNQADGTTGSLGAVAPFFTRSLNHFSRFIRFIKGDLSEERLSATDPLSLPEALVLALNLHRSSRSRDGRILSDPSFRRKLQVLCERSPGGPHQDMQMLLQAIPADIGQDDPVQAIQEAEATLQDLANRPPSEFRGFDVPTHIRLAAAHLRLSNLDKAMEHLDKAKAATENAPPGLSARLVPFLENIRSLIEHTKDAEPRRNLDPFLESTLQSILSGDGNLQSATLLGGGSDNPPFSSSDTRILSKYQARWDLLVATTRLTSPTATEADTDALEKLLQSFEILRNVDPAAAKTLALQAAVGYFALGEKLITSSDSPSIESIQRARFYHEASLGALEYVGIATHRLLYANHLWASGRTWRLEGKASSDPAAYQSALEQFRAAEEELHELRGLQEPAADDPLQKLIAKQQIAGHFDARLIFGEVFQCCLVGAYYACNGTQLLSFFQQAWELVQRRKSRSLLDVMSLEACIPVSMLSALREHPEQNALLQKEARLMATLSSSPLADRTTTRNELRSLRTEMKQHTPLNIAMRARDGEGLALQDLRFLSERISRGRVVFVDWFTHLDVIFLFTAFNNPDPKIICHRLGISESTVSTWARSNLNTRVLSNNVDSYSRLKELRDLIAPLKFTTNPGDVLVLCPTATLHQIPLHALEIDGTEILLERNPVVYTPSLSILQHQLNVVENARAVQEPGPWHASVMSAYEASEHNLPREVAAVSACLSHLASALGTTVQNGPHVNVPYFRDSVRSTDLIHFHGHAISGSSAETQALVLQPSTPISPNQDDNHLTARSIFTSLTLNRNPLVVNIACASGKQEIKPGDEPFGLTTAFLFAGAKTVIGTLWPLKSADGRRFTRLFYSAIREQTKGSVTVDVARAVQKAALAIREVEETEAPYHWGSFVTCGLWEYSFGGEIGEFNDDITAS